MSGAGGRKNAVEGSCFLKLLIIYLKLFETAQSHKSLNSNNRSAKICLRYRRYELVSHNQISYKKDLSLQHPKQVYKPLQTVFFCLFFPLCFVQNCCGSFIIKVLLNSLYFQIGLFLEMLIFAKQRTRNLLRSSPVLLKIDLKISGVHTDNEYNKEKVPGREAKCSKACTSCQGSSLILSSMCWALL